jgi:hypothetical protein
VRSRLADVSGDTFFRVSESRPQGREYQYGKSGEFQDYDLVVASRPENQVIQPAVHGFGLQNVIEDNLKRPWLGEVHADFAENGEYRYCQTSGVRP